MPPTDSKASRALVLDGQNIRIYVSKGELVISAGYLYGTDTRKLRLTRGGELPEQIIIRGNAYSISGDALTWCELAKIVKVSWAGGGRTTKTTQGIRVINVDTRTGTKERGTTGYPRWRELTTSEPERNHPFYRRLQVLSGPDMPMHDTLGLDIHRYLMSAKLAGQADTLRKHFAGINAEELASRAAKAENAGHAEIKKLELKGAEIYFDGTWKDQTLWRRAGSWSCPTEWLTYSGRGSAISGTKNDPTDPVNAVLNYAYKILQMQTVVAMRMMCLDPELSIDHSMFEERRYGGSMDVMEPARPVIDRMVLELLDSIEIGSDDFFAHQTYAANPDTGFAGTPGQVSLGRDIKHHIIAMAPDMFDAVAPYVEGVAALLHPHTKIRSKMPTPLTKSNNKREQDRRKKAG